MDDHVRVARLRCRANKVLGWLEDGDTILRLAARDSRRIRCWVGLPVKGERYERLTEHKISIISTVASIKGAGA